MNVSQGSYSGLVYSTPSNVLNVTLTGLVSLIKFSLNNVFSYAVSGNFQGDMLQREFGIYRHLSGRQMLLYIQARKE